MAEIDHPPRGKTLEILARRPGALSCRSAGAQHLQLAREPGPALDRSPLAATHQVRLARDAALRGRAVDELLGGLHQVAPLKVVQLALQVLARLGAVVPGAV